MKVTADNCAIPAATVRGLLDYEYRCDRLVLRPRVPGCITRYEQNEPVRFGAKRVYLSCRNGGPRVKSATVNGQSAMVQSPDALVLVYDELPVEARIEITTEGGWPREPASAVYPAIPALLHGKGKSAAAPAELPESLRRPLAVLSAMSRLLAAEPGADCQRAFVSAALDSCEACRARAALDPGPGYYRAITPQRKAAILEFYEQTALAMYSGFARRMAVYAEKGDARQKRWAALFAAAQRPSSDVKGQQG